jgi:hypothetical protein
MTKPNGNGRRYILSSVQIAGIHTRVDSFQIFTLCPPSWKVLIAGSRRSDFPLCLCGLKVIYLTTEDTERKNKILRVTLKGLSCLTLSLGNLFYLCHQLFLISLAFFGIKLNSNCHKNNHSENTPDSDISGQVILEYSQ